MNNHPKETDVRCWHVKIKSNTQGIMDRLEDDDNYLLLINGTSFIEQIEPWLDTYFENDSPDGIGDTFGMEAECVLVKKSDLMEIEQIDPGFTEQDIDEAIDYQQEIFG